LTGLSTNDRDGPLPLVGLLRSRNDDITLNALVTGELKRDLLDGLNAEQRKQYPLCSGVLWYFWNALVRVAHVSWVGNQQHNPGQPLHWARGKSTDQTDCIIRHLGEYDPGDMSDESELAIASVAWRALAELEVYLERKYGLRPPVNARSDV